MKVHVLSTICESGRAAVIMNVCALVFQVVFIITIVKYDRQQKIIESKAHSKNPMGFVIPSLVWGTSVTAVVFTVIIILQVVALRKQ